MTELGPIFARLGLEQYLDSFTVEGFDTWEIVLDIQEGDLYAKPQMLHPKLIFRSDALNVKLGHRRVCWTYVADTIMG
jgi:hypothetical protein